VKINTNSAVLYSLLRFTLEKSEGIIKKQWILVRNKRYCFYIH